jgi:hypothetical protein
MSAKQLHSSTNAGAQPGSKAVAGYLAGLSGELAIKHLMVKSGMKPLPTGERRDDPFFAHFPQIKTLLKDNAHGRNSGVLLNHAQNPKLFRNWCTDMRYAPTADVNGAWSDEWLESATKLIEDMDL